MSDNEILRDLAMQYVEVCNDPVQEERRDLWRAHNSLKPTRPLIYVRAFAWPEQIGTDYVISYRPSPADMVGYGFDETRIRSILKRDLEACRGLHVDITLQDVETVQHDPVRVRNWVALTREVIEAI